MQYNLSLIHTLGATLEKMMRPEGKPYAAAVCVMFASPTAGNLSSHKQELGTCQEIITLILLMDSYNKQQFATR